MRSATKAALITGGVIVAALGIFGIGVVVLEAIGFLITPYAPSYYYQLNYDNMYFDENKGTVHRARIGTVEHGYRVPDLYVQFSNDPKQTYDFPRLQEDVVRQMALSERKRELGGKLEIRYVVATGNGTLCEVTFYGGRAAGLEIDGPSAIRISPTKDGEYIELPTKRRDIIRAFGKPLNIERREAGHTVH